MRRPLLLLGLLPLLVGCSVISIAYNNADRLALAYIDDWFDLDRAQGKRFRERFRERMLVHRQDELPRYSAFLQQVRGLVLTTPAGADIEALFTESREIIELGIRRTLPLMADTLAELTPSQVEHFAEELAEANEKYAKELLETSVEDSQRRREKELIKDIERWTGQLDDPQRDRLRALVKAIPDGAQVWFDYRKQRQRGLLQLLRSRAGRDAYVGYAEEWWLGERHLEPALVDQLERNRVVAAMALADLVNSLTTKQRKRVVARVDSLIGDLDGLHADGIERAARAAR